jgi:hypothetical protein
MNTNRNKTEAALKLMIILIAMVFMACSGQSGKRAGQGAATGAVVGAAGGVVSALVFGGNVGEAASRGAVWGASTGAVSGAIVGAQEDQAKKKQRDAAVEKLKANLGDDAFSGLAALAECKHEVALGYAKTAAKLNNKDYALAGLWLEVLTLADRKDEDRARSLFPDLVKNDPEISSNAQAEEGMRNALQGLMNIRGEYNLPKTCR